MLDFETLRRDLRWKCDRARDVLRSHRPAAIGCGIGTAAVLVLGVVFLSSGSGPRLAKRVPMVDVRTGDMHWVSVASRAVSVPAPNPDSGERTMVGAEQTPDGLWRVLPQDLELLGVIDGAISPRIDRSTGVVRAESEGAR